MLSNGKLPRGSFYYLMLGDRYFSGTKPVIDEFKENRITVNPLHNRKLEGKQWRPFAQLSTSRFMRLEPKERRQHTGKIEPTFSSEFDEAKQFRRLSQVNTAKENIEHHFRDIGAKPTIHTHHGANQ